MKEQIYTIPINEHFGRPGGCPVCRLFHMLEEESLDCSVGAAMMEPAVRREMNAKGFCARHYRAMLARQKRLSLALTLESRLQHLPPASAAAAEGGAPCYVCGRVSGFMDGMYANIVYLWLRSQEFREKLSAAEMICLPHTAGLLKSAGRHAGKKEYAAISAALEEKLEASRTRALASVSAFCKSFDHRFSGADLGENRHAVENAIEFLTGEKP